MRGDSNDLYIVSINKVIDYIEVNLHKKLRLEELSDIAGFSKYHFHRIFSSYMKETLNNFIMRLRIEKAAMMICSNPNSTLTEVAYKCGFSDSAAFSKAFKRRFDLPANKWSKKSYLLSTNQLHNRNVANPEFIESEIADIYVSSCIKELPNMTIAYIRYIGKYAGDGELFKNLFIQLTDCLSCKNIDYSRSKVVCLYHDSLNLTEEDKLRLSVGIEVNESFDSNEKLGKLLIKKGKYLVARFKVNEKQYQTAWDYVFGYLLNMFGVKPASESSFELYNPCGGYNENHNVSICVPIAD